MKLLRAIRIILVLFILSYILFIIFEVLRFDNNLGVAPTIVVGPVDIHVEAESNLQKEKISGLGYTIEYEYVVERDLNSDVQTNKIISGTFKLFDKIILSSWIE